MRTRPSILSLTLRSIIIAVAVTGTLWAQTTGKISGRVVDNATGDPLPGANVLIDETALGAATDADGYYFIIAVPPGTYSVRAQVIGYATIIQSEVRVMLNLTTTADFNMSVETIAGEEVNVVAVRPVVQPDISANIANVTAEEVEYVPVAGVSEFINLQAGIEPGMRIRGAGTDALAFIVDGSSMRDARSNRPFSAISFTAIDEVQIQTGGFNAEFGNVRSGLINVVTKDPPRDSYTADVLLRYTPPQALNFGGTAKDSDAHYWRPYTDPEVKLVGTAAPGVWDTYTQRQYAAFDGWTHVAEEHVLNAEQLQEVFAYHHRKSVEVEVPEYDVDVTLGGPVVPGLSSSLGGLRFLASYRQTQDPYLYPQARKAYTENTAQLKLMADLGPAMRLTLSALQGKQSGMAHRADQTVENEMPQSGGIPSYPWDPRWNSMYSFDGGHTYRSMIFGTGLYAITDVTRSQFGATLTHTLSPKTFYKASLNQVKSKYDSHPDARRVELKDEYKNNGNAIDSLAGSMTSSTGGDSLVYYYLDTAPFDWTSSGTSSPGSGLRLGGHWARARDTSRIAISTVKFDLTNQTNSWSQLKTGVELIHYDFDINYSSDDSVIVHLNRSKQRWDRKTMQAAFYAQEKLEFRGMIANLGLRLDYYNPGGDWWDYEDYEREFANAGMATREDVLDATAKTTDKQLTLSPRVGVSFPITVNSKLFFNYGHFRDILVQRELFQVRTWWLGKVGNIGNPNHPLLKTVAYELGYEQSILDQYLLRLSGYYRDMSNQPGDVYYGSIDYEVGYNVSIPRNYGDVRGVEVTLNKPRGQWFRGFVNYTYMIEKSGDFGYGTQYENDVEMANFLRTNADHYQNKPVAMPYARTDLEFIMPATFGPGVLGLYPLGDWHLNLLGGWRAGEVFTWAGGAGAIPGLENNVRMKDFFSFDIRLSKNFQTGLGRAQFFVDITNVLNLKHMYFSPDAKQPFEWGSEQPTVDWNYYMKSLHLDKDTYADIEGEGPYIFIPGDDRPGDYRKEGAAFVPIEVRATEAGVKAIEFAYLESDRRVLGWAKDTEKYYEYENGTWNEASSSFVDQVLNDKAYIDMPNETYRTFLNPRKILFGLRVYF